MSRRRPRPRASKSPFANKPPAMPDAELAEWLAKAPSARPAHTLSALDGFVTALVIGPRFVEPPEWICELLGDHAFCAGATTPEASAIQAIVARYNHLSATLSAHPERYQPLLESLPDGEPDARSWAMGFFAAIKPRVEDWRDLIDMDGVEHGLMLPVFLHGVNEPGALNLGPATKALLRETCGLIKPMVIAIRELWMPRRIAD